MATNGGDSSHGEVGLSEVWSALKQIQQTQAQLLSAVESMGLRTNSPVLRPSALPSSSGTDSTAGKDTPPLASSEAPGEHQGQATSPTQKSGFTSRIVLT